MSSIQSDFRRLMSEIEGSQDPVLFTIDNQKLADEFNYSPKFYEKIGYSGDYYALSPDDFQEFQQFVLDNHFTDQDWHLHEPESDDFKSRSMDEMSVTGGEAFLPGLDVPEKKYKYGYTQDLKENEIHDGYKKVKGFRPGHTPDKGGFQYKDLWNVNEREETQVGDLKVGDKVEIDKSYNSSWKYNGFGQIVAFNGEKDAVVNITNGGGSTFLRDELIIPIDKISLQQGEIKKRKKKEKEKEEKEEKREKAMKKNSVDTTELQEGIKTDIKVRSNKQQFQEATRLARKKMNEINSILEYASQLKTGLNEMQCESCSRTIESMKHSLAEAYKKLKNL